MRCELAGRRAFVFPVAEEIIILKGQRSPPCAPTASLAGPFPVSCSCIGAFVFLTFTTQRARKTYE